MFVWCHTQTCPSDGREGENIEFVIYESTLLCVAFYSLVFVCFLLIPSHSNIISQFTLTEFKLLCGEFITPYLKVYLKATLQHFVFVRGKEIWVLNLINNHINPNSATYRKNILYSRNCAQQKRKREEGKEGKKIYKGSPTHRWQFRWRHLFWLFGRSLWLSLSLNHSASVSFPSVSLSNLLSSPSPLNLMTVSPIRCFRERERSCFVL